MTAPADLGADIRGRVAEAAARKVPLAIVGGGTKRFLGREVHGEPLELAAHRGVVNYDPEELVLTARAGTPMDELEALLSGHGQMFAFEPPHFGASATLGGTISANLSGPRRAFAGSARDFVLGVRIVNGRGEILRFGGEVMKNVAGYDVSRLITGAMGTLGVILDVSLKVLPRPRASVTLVRRAKPRDAIDLLCRWARAPWPVSATCIESGQLYVRLSGSPSALAKARAAMGGEALDGAAAFWMDLREQRRPFFSGAAPLWRISLPPSATLELAGEQVIEWGGALRWLKTDADADTIRAMVAQQGGHAMRFRGAGPAPEPYHPMSEPMLRLHRRIKDALDPWHVLNPGRMYAGL